MSDLSGMTDLLQSIAIAGLATGSIIQVSTVRHMRRVLLAAKNEELARLLDDNRVLRAQLERARKP